VNLKELEAQLDELESKLYCEEAYDEAINLCMEAERLFDTVLDHFGLTYFMPGEPEAYGTQRDGSEVKIPLTGHNADMLTWEEEQRLFDSDGKDNIPNDLYWARLRAQQARDILDDGWQFGLIYSEEAS